MIQSYNAQLIHRISIQIYMYIQIKDITMIYENDLHAAFDQMMTHEGISNGSLCIHQNLVLKYTFVKFSKKWIENMLNN
jgi:hypothetical protein